MKQTTVSYTFDSAGKTVTLHGFNHPLSNVWAILDSGKILYSIYDGVGAAGYVQAVDSVITLQSSQGLGNTTPLTIMVDDGQQVATDTTQAKVKRALNREDEVVANYWAQFLEPHDAQYDTLTETSIPKTIYDILNPTDPNNFPLNVALAGIDIPGQQTKDKSFPVVQPDEHIKDYFNVRQIPVGSTYVGQNVLSVDGSAFDCSLYRSIQLTLCMSVSTATATVNFEGSNDGTTWMAVPLQQQNSPAAPPVSFVIITFATTGTALAYSGLIGFRYFRARLTAAVVGGTMSCGVRLSMVPNIQTVQYVALHALTGAATVSGGLAGTLGIGGPSAPGVAPTSYPLHVGGQDPWGFIRRLRADLLGNTNIVGPNPNLNPSTGVNPFPLQVQLDRQESGAGYADHDLFFLIYNELRTISLYLQELPFLLNNGLSIKDEPSTIYDDTFKR